LFVAELDLDQWLYAVRWSGYLTRP
jgi:hypothetical protein